MPHGPTAPQPSRVSAIHRVRAALAATALAAVAPVGVWARAPQAPSVQELAGDWTVDLRPSPTAPAYLRPMRIDVARDNAVTGTFYGSAIAAGRADASKGRACFAFTTRDGSGPYQTSGCLAGRRIEGQTWSEGRRFLLTWTATRPR